MNEESTKDKIFNTATELFSQFGYSNVSMRAIARQVGVTEGAIYRHYTGKEAILDDILDVFKRKQYNFLISKEQAMEYLEDHSARELLEYGAEYFLQEDRHFISCVYRIICRENLTKPGLHEIIDGLGQTHIAQNIEYVLNMMIERGDIPAMDTASFALTWAQAKLFTAQRWASCYYDKEQQDKTVADYRTMYRWMIEVALTGKAPASHDCEPIELMKQHTTNYVSTFIEIAEDCPVSVAGEPPLREPKTAARIEYEMLINNPYRYTSDDILYESNGSRRGINRKDFFSKGQPCFRSSALTKRYGWGVHCDNNGKIAIYAVESPDYKRFSSDESINHIRAMRLSKK